MENYSDQELDFNLEQLKEWEQHFPNLSLKAYLGPFKHLDLTQTWFCPRCRNLDKPLLLSSDKETLYCDSHPHECEYNYSNFEKRKVKKSFLGEGYSLPLSVNDVANISLRKFEDEKLKIIQERHRLDKLEEEIESHIITLKRTLK
ncbi:hypothetical protein FDJ25_gp062 [Vibrio phage Aphrodite1]|uniref:Uncharacterized protein n=1 Tax=Vibrio phage Aphrodite1 TaxID=2070057 RepID=A0A2I7QI37_9CAUD|nr:hypothetical protein FDJ25_gp062 [Vibrio phage Aphrodite1]AUR81062.1 hypothetical protein Aphrodite1_0141 [Vibrio phage Aphrodite1]